MPRKPAIVPAFSEQDFYMRLNPEDYTYKTSFSSKIINKLRTTERRFGIEIEAFGLTHQEVANLLCENGINCEAQRYNHTTQNIWKVVGDSSIRTTNNVPTFELVSPPLTGQNGINAVIKVVDLLFEAGASVNRTCGIHVHVDLGLDVGVTQIQMINRRFCNWEQELDYFFALSRRESRNTYCRGEVIESSTETSRYPFVNIQQDKRINEYEWLRLFSYRFGYDIRRQSSKSLNYAYNAFRQAVYNANNPTSSIVRNVFSDRYRKLNFSSFLQHGTVEFRQLEGTLDSNKIKHWINFCVNFINESFALSATYIEANGVSCDTPSRYNYFLDVIEDHPFSGLNEESYKFMTRIIKGRNRDSYKKIHEKVYNKNNLAGLSIDNRRILFAKMNIAFPNLQMLSNGNLNFNIPEELFCEAPKKVTFIPDETCEQILASTESVYKFDNKEAMSFIKTQIDDYFKLIPRAPKPVPVAKFYNFTTASSSSTFSDFIPIQWSTTSTTRRI